MRLIGFIVDEEPTKWWCKEENVGCGAASTDARSLGYYRILKELIREGRERFRVWGLGFRGKRRELRSSALFCTE